MYIQEIAIEIKTIADKDQLMDEFGLLMSYYRGSGQTQGRIESQYIDGNRLVCLPYTLEQHSLNEKFNNFYVNRQSKKLEELCGCKLTFRTIGKSYASYQSPCCCEKSEFYLLITNYTTVLPPLTCGTCNKPVPLYRLPHYEDFGYRPVLSWETNYIACDRLQMNCEIGERWALNQMQVLTSPLSQQGIKICRKLEELTSVPTYYFLYNYNKYKGDDASRPCPGCQRKWNLTSRLHDLYDFKCDHCRIISTISPII